MNLAEHFQKNRSRYYLILICLFTFLISAKGITEEDNVVMNGDMQKYLMNGVFFYDFMKDLPFSDPLGYAYRYFARYPALSLGHHPLLLPVAEAPFYAIFGVSVFSARLTIAFFMFIGVTAWFLLVRKIADETAAVLSSLLLVTTPFIAEYSRVVMSEIPTLSLIIVTVYLFFMYCETDKKKYIIYSALSLSLGIYSKHIAVFLIPVLLLYLIIRKGFTALAKREIIIASLLTILLIAPFIFITMEFSRANLSFVSNAMSSKHTPFINPLSNRIMYYLRIIWEKHLTVPVFVICLAAVPMSLIRRDKRTTIFFLWIIISFSLAVILGFQVSRYAIYWIPVFCFFAITPIDLSGNRLWRKFIVSVLAVIIGYQFFISFEKEPDFSTGYEEAARYIIENKKGGSVLYSGIYDTGYFIFFVRKHNPGNDLLVLRADKLLATSRMSWVIDDRIHDRSEVYDALKRYGIRYVVLEDTESKSHAIEWLREEVKSDNFELRKEIIMRSSSSRVNNVPLDIYEYKGYTEADEGQVLKMNIPLMGGSIEVPMKDLLGK